MNQTIMILGFFLIAVVLVLWGKEMNIEKRSALKSWHVLPFIVSPFVAIALLSKHIVFASAFPFKLWPFFILGLLVTCFAIDRWGVKKMLLGSCLVHLIATIVFTWKSFGYAKGLVVFNERYDVFLHTFMLGIFLASSVSYMQAFSGLPSRLRAFGILWPQLISITVKILLTASIFWVFNSWGRYHHHLSTPVLYVSLALAVMMWGGYVFFLRRLFPFPSFSASPCTKGIVESALSFLKNGDLWLSSSVFAFFIFILNFGFFVLSGHPFRIIIKKIHFFSCPGSWYLLGCSWGFLWAWGDMRFFSDKADPKSYICKNRQSACIWLSVVGVLLLCHKFLKPFRGNDLAKVFPLSVDVIKPAIIILIVISMTKAVFHCVRLYCATLTQVYDDNSDRPALVCGLWWTILLIFSKIAQRGLFS